MSRKPFLVLIACGLMTLIAQPTTLAATTPTLAGSWELTFTPNAPPTPPAIPIPGLATFTTDGSVIETDGTELAPGVAPSGGATYGSPGHGIWQLLPAATALYVSYTSVSVNGDGSLNATSVTVATVTVKTTSSGTTLSGEYTTTTASTGGTTTTSSGKLTGTLIPHPALP